MVVVGRWAVAPHATSGAVPMVQWSVVILMRVKSYISGSNPIRLTPSPFFLPYFLPPCSRCKIGGYDPVMEATKIMLDYGDYFTILLTGISGIFVNNLPLSS